MLLQSVDNQSVVRRLFCYVPETEKSNNFRLQTTAQTKIAKYAIIPQALRYKSVNAEVYIADFRYVI